MESTRQHLNTSREEEVILVADLGDPAHGSAVLTLLDAYARGEMGGGAPLADDVRQQLLPALQRRPQAHVLLAFSAGQPAALAICMEGFSTFACKPLLNIHDFMVAEGFRGRGLSQRMLAQVEALARQLGCCKITLEVLEGNTVAQRAYRAFGFDGYELLPETGKALFWQKKLA